MADADQLEAIIEAATSFVAAMDTSGRPRWVNSPGRRLCGLGEQLPEQFSAFCPEWAARVLHEEAIPAAINDGVWRGESALLAQDGSEVPGWQTVIAHRDAGGSLAALLLIFRDRRDTRELEARLRYQAGLLDAVGDAIVAADLEGRIEYWNAAAERLYGWSSEEVLGRDVVEVTASELDAARGREIFAALRRGEQWSGEFTIRHRDGRVIPALITNSPYIDEHGSLAGILGVATDISDLRRAQQEAQRRIAQQSAVARLGQEALDTPDIDVFLRRVCVCVADVLDAELCKVLELDREAGHMHLRAGTGWDEEVVREAVVPNDAGSQAGYTLLVDKPVVVSDFGLEERFTAPRLLVEHGVDSGMSTQISLGDGRVYGVLGVHSRRARDFTDDDTAFLRSVANIVGSAIDRDAAAAAHERLALYDPLTRLSNRTLLRDRLAGALARARYEPARVAVLFIDIDRFKLVNDSWGHHAGDELLTAVAERLRSSVRAGDTVARVGGDEFVVVCEDLPAGQAAALQQTLDLADRVNAGLDGHYELSDGEIHVTATIGATLNKGDDDPLDLVREADAAMDRAKQDAPGRVAVFDEEMRTRSYERLQLANELRHAYHEGEFFVVYQPQIDLGTGEVVGLEALLRWQHREKGTRGPGEFLPLAEEVGLIGELGAWVLSRACQEVVDMFPGVGGQPPGLAVNLSPRQLVESGLIGTVEEVLHSSGLPPERLCLEITESAMIDDPHEALLTLQQLQGLGVRIALDDFGTGYSSLTHLTQFPIDTIKIDRSFVSPLPDPGSHREIIQAVIGLAGTLDLLCVGEGVETEAQLQALRALGCGAGQGYHWSRPLPAARIVAALRDLRGG
ncbi:EAL and GGDEF domain-containing protein [Egibacter rhizosphaerae]|nr:EAL domain-containing protein [Egibacter rhizosphaerae]